MLPYFLEEQTESEREGRLLRSSGARSWGQAPPAYTGLVARGHPRAGTGHSYTVSPGSPCINPRLLTAGISHSL